MRRSQLNWGWALQEHHLALALAGRLRLGPGGIQRCLRLCQGGPRLVQGWGVPRGEAMGGPARRQLPEVRLPPLPSVRPAPRVAHHGGLRGWGKVLVWSAGVTAANEATQRCSTTSVQRQGGKEAFQQPKQVAQEFRADLWVGPTATVRTVRSGGSVAAHKAFREAARGRLLPQPCVQLRPAGARPKLLLAQRMAWEGGAG